MSFALALPHGPLTRVVDGVHLVRGRYPMGPGAIISRTMTQNHCDTEGTSFLARVMAPMMGFKGGLIVPSMWRKCQKIQGAQVTAAFTPLAGLEFANRITGHGPAIVGGADTQTRAAIALAAVG